jgi:ketosteroid isomerase-like protein
MTPSEPDPIAVIERYLALIADPVGDLDAIEALLDPDFHFIEHPNLVSPNGSERDVEQVRASASAGRRLLRSQRFDVVDHLVDGDEVATRVVWTGELVAGSRLRADSSMHFELRGGRIVRQENFDCFHANHGA